jgi:putative nucleotidyltransferase with HDIG domain
MIERDDALMIIDTYLKDDKIIKHCLAVEAIMKTLANKFEEDEQLWSLIGLLHDLDYEYTQGNPEKHGVISAQILSGLLPLEGVNAILSHNYIHTEVLPTSLLDKCLLASDAASGLIIATALVMPSKKISEIKIGTLLDKFKDKSFAKGCNRDRIKLCADCNITLEDFLELCLDSIRKISDVLGL